MCVCVCVYIYIYIYIYIMNIYIHIMNIYVSFTASRGLHANTTSYREHTRQRQNIRHTKQSTHESWKSNDFVVMVLLGMRIHLRGNISKRNRQRVPRGACCLGCFFSEWVRRFLHQCCHRVKDHLPACFP